MESLKKIVQQTSWQVLGKIFTSFSTIIILSLISRNYGEDGIGLYSLIITYITLFYLVADLGLNAYILPILLKEDVNNEQEQVNFNWRKLLGLRIFLSGILIILSILILPLLPFSSNQFNIGVIFASLAIMANAVYTTANLWLQYKFRYDISVISTIIGGTFFILISAVFINSNYPVMFIAFANMLGWVICAGMVLLFIKRFKKFISPIFDVKYSINILKGAWPIAATLVLNVAYFKIDTFILSTFRNISEVGIYNLAYQPFQAALVLPTFIMNALYPILIKEISNKNSFKLLVYKYSILLFLIAMSGTLVTLLLSKWVINLISGGVGFGASPTVLNILALGFPGFYLSALFMWVLLTMRMQKQVLGIYAVGLLFNFLSNLIYIPQYGFFAAAIVTVISEYLILILQIIILYRYLLKR